MTVGGRTSAYVAELQRLRGHTPGLTSRKGRRKDEEDDESDLTPLSEDEDAVGKTNAKSRKRKASAIVMVAYRSSEAKRCIGCYLKTLSKDVSETTDQEHRYSRHLIPCSMCALAQLRCGRGMSSFVSFWLYVAS